MKNILFPLTIIAVLVLTPVAGDYYVSGDVIYSGTLMIEESGYRSIVINISRYNATNEYQGFRFDFETHDDIDILLLLLEDENEVPYDNASKYLDNSSMVFVVQGNGTLPYIMDNSENKTDDPYLLQLVFYNMLSTPVEYNLTISYVDNLIAIPANPIPSYGASQTESEPAPFIVGWLPLLVIATVVNERRRYKD